MTEPGAISGAAWGDYVRRGQDHFETLSRSYNIFAVNAGELWRHLAAAETNVAISIMLMQPGPRNSSDDRQEFWAEVDRLLHNMVASAVSVVDHTRPLIDNYSHEKAFVAAWKSRSDRVSQLLQTKFLRRLRNYLVHKGVAPVAVTMSLASKAAGEEWDGTTIQLSGPGLLQNFDWNAELTAYIESFETGPPLRRITQEYADEMAGLYKWLLNQYSALHVPGVPPSLIAGTRGSTWLTDE